MSNVKFQTNSLNSGDFEGIFDFTQSDSVCLGIPFASLLNDHTAILSISFLDCSQDIKASIEGDGVIIGTRSNKNLDFKFHLKSGSGKILLTNGTYNYYFFWGFKPNGFHIINIYESIFIDFSNGVEVINKPNYLSFQRITTPPLNPFFSDWTDV